MFNNTITLSNGVVVPQLALGTWLIDNDKAADAGEGIRNSGVAREEIFVTTKVAAEHKDYHILQNSLLIHEEK